MDKWSGGASNTRPQTPSETPVRVLVDWLSVTFNLVGDYDDVKQFLYLDHLDWELHDFGMNTFKTHIRSGNLVIQNKDEYTYQLFLTGQGCREYEQVGHLDWLQLIALLKKYANARATRIDLAIDDFKGYYNVGMIRGAFFDGRCVTRFRHADIKQSYTTGDLELTMDSFYLGSQSSRLSINFYDKKLEREGKGLEVTVDKWTRTELRCKREYADEVLDMILIYGGDVGTIAMGILKKNVRFVRKSNDKKAYRRPTIKWWSDFVKNVESLSFTLVAPDKTIETTKSWLTRAVAPSLATIRKADPLHFDKFLESILDNGAERLNSRHLSMIQQHQRVLPQSVLNAQEASRKRLQDDIDQATQQLDDFFNKSEK